MARPRLGHALQSGLQIGASTAGILAVTAIAARGLGPDRMGTYGILLFAQQIAVLLASAGWAAAATRYMAAAHAAGDTAAVDATFRTTIGKAARGSILFGSLILAAALAAGEPWRSAAGPLAIGIPAQALFAVLTAACQALGRFRDTAAASTLAAPVLVAGAWWVMSAGLGVPGLLAVLALSFGLQAGLMAAALRGRRARPISPSGDSSSERLGPPASSRPHEATPESQSQTSPDLAGYARACLTMSMLDAVVWQRSELFFLGYFSPAAAAGQYHIAHGLAGTAMKSVPGALIPLLVPAMAGARTSAELADTYRSATRWMAILAIPVATGVCLVAGPLVRLLCGPGYDAVAPLLAGLAVCNAAVMVLGYPASSVLYAAGGEQVIAKVGVAVAALNIVLALALIPPHGAIGAVLANAIAQLASLGPGMHLAFARMPGRPALRDLLLPLAASGLMIPPVWAALHALPPLPGLIAAIASGAATYALSLVLLGGVRTQEIRRVIIRTER